MANLVNQAETMTSWCSLTIMAVDSIGPAPSITIIINHCIAIHLLLMVLSLKNNIPHRKKASKTCKIKSFGLNDKKKESKHINVHINVENFLGGYYIKN